MELCNHAEPEPSTPACLPQLLHEQARLRPEKTAVEYDGVRLTFREVVRLSSELSGYLEHCGVAARRLRRPFRRAVARADGRRLGNPLLRRRLSAAVAGVPRRAAALHDRGLRHKGHRHPARTRVPAHGAGPRRHGRSSHPRTPRASARPAPARALGRPGVRHLHLRQHGQAEGGDDRARAASSARCAGSPPPTGSATAETVLQKTPMSFDAAQWEILAPACGASVVMGGPGVYRDAERLVETIREHGVTTLQCVPTLLQALLDTGELGTCTSLRQVFTGGEALSRPLAREALDALPWCDLVNLYGPTECTINSSAYTVRPGRPRAGPGLDTDRHPGARHRVPHPRRRRARPVAAGETGELYIGGRPARPRIPAPAGADRGAVRGRPVRRRGSCSGPATWPTGTPTAPSSSSAGPTTR